MNDNVNPLEQDVQTDVLDETFVMSDIQIAPVSIAENISTASVLPKDTLPNKTKSKKVELRESVETVFLNCQKL